MSKYDYMPDVYPDFTNTDDVLAWTGKDNYNAIYTITLGELIENDIFKWDNEELNWSNVAYSDEQYKRICDYFINRFYFREISIEPYFEWAQMLKRKITYELMPKYKIMYQFLDDDFDIAQTGANYNKGRNIGSTYPETLLSGNSDYISNGSDTESERIDRGNLLDSYLEYAEKFQAIDKQLLDELECLFISLYTVSLNGA